MWAALDQIFPTTEHQRCWNQRVLNVQSKLPKRLQAQARGRLREMSQSETQALCEERRDDYITELRALGQEKAGWETRVLELGALLVEQACAGLCGDA